MDKSLTGALIYLKGIERVNNSKAQVLAMLNVMDRRPYTMDVIWKALLWWLHSLAEITSTYMCNYLCLLHEIPNLYAVCKHASCL